MEVRIDPQASAALIDNIQVQQVLLNPVRNAAEAMSDSPHPALVVGSAPAAGRMIEVGVADRGPGLAAAVRDRLAIQLQGGGADRVVLIDPATGAVTGRISLVR